MGPATATQTVKFPYYDTLRKTKALHTAWRKVYSNGIRSKSLDTKKLVIEFNNNAHSNIERIYRQILRDKFKFAPAKGIPIRRPPKAPRPIVLAPIANRIVQRSILDVLQAQRSIYKYVNTPFSFGAIKDYHHPKGVHNAVKAVQNAIAGGAKWYIQSDIKNFFTKIPKRMVLDVVSSLIPDKKFIELFTAATDVELENMAELGGQAELFPIYEIGVAQGCCLSPLIGNILLHDFDAQMNGRRVVCLRYIDDFIVLADTKKRAEAAFRNALKALESLGLDAYDPKNEIAKPKKDRKANIGPTGDGIDFLGCEIVGNKIRPNKDSRDRLLGKIDKTINESRKLMKAPGICCANKKSFIDTLKSINDILKGWGNQYFYCNEIEPIEKMDRTISERLNGYIGYYSSCLNCFHDGDFVNRRRLLGVHLLIDSFNRNQPNLEPQ